MAGNGAENTVMETRMEFMASQSMVIRRGHFLKPSFASKNAILPNLPPHAFTYNQKNSGVTSLNVNFKGWQTPYRAWDEWVLQMEPLYGALWKSLGIFDAIKNSTLQICQHKDVVLGLARKWFPETNTFVFKWGEASVTLEDICVLGGYPVSGDSVCLSNNAYMREIDLVDRRLMVARKLIRSGVKKVPYNRWIDFFQEKREGFEDLEHVGFLVFWLSKYVFPKGGNVVGKHVHYIAIRLAAGLKVALAPPVLASIYHDLKKLQTSISTASDLNYDVMGEVEVWGPMQLVQIWAWERFPDLGPRSSQITPHQQIMARWEGHRCLRYEHPLNVDQVIENCANGFVWRPYGDFYEHHELTRNMYMDTERWVVEGFILDADMEAMVRFVRPSELVGMGCIEQYLPHRVARQFGFDQDLPGQLSRFNQSKEAAWANYNRPVWDKKLYVPARLVETKVTTRYLQWWDRSKSGVEAGPSRWMRE